jgi:hypothetical protein
MWLSTPQIGKELGIAAKTVWGWIKDGIPTVRGRAKLHAVRIGYRYRVRRDWLDTFLLACNDGQTLEPVSPKADEKRAKKRQAEARKLLAGA